MLVITIVFSFYCEVHVTYNDIKEEFCSIAIKESSDLIDKIKEHPFNVELINIAFLIIVRTGHRKAESTARRKDSNRGMFFLALFFIANQ